jgi:hypothetical protein
MPFRWGRVEITYVNPLNAALIGTGLRQSILVNAIIATGCSGDKEIASIFTWQGIASMSTWQGHLPLASSALRGWSGLNSDKLVALGWSSTWFQLVLGKPLSFRFSPSHVCVASGTWEYIDSRWPGNVSIRLFGSLCPILERLESDESAHQTEVIASWLYKHGQRRNRLWNRRVLMIRRVLTRDN